MELFGESQKHISAKERLTQLAKLLPYKPFTEYKEFQKELTERGLPSYTPDVYCQPRQGGIPPLILEADGTVGHSTTTATQKMSERDEWFWLAKGTRTLRIKLKDLVGESKASDAEIIAELWYQYMTYRK